MKLLVFSDLHLENNPSLEIQRDAVRAADVIVIAGDIHPAPHGIQWARQILGDKPSEYPGIEQRARAEGAEIHWGDETALVSTDVRGRSYAPAGKTPVAFAIGGTRQKLSMIATVTNQGKAC